MIPKYVPIPGYESLYMITDSGSVLSIKAHKVLKQREVPKGYLRVNLSKKNKKTTYWIHQLVMLTFHPEGKSNILNTVHHRDNNPHNNNINNLEWMSKKDNTTIRNKRNVKKANEDPTNPF